MTAVRVEGFTISLGGYGAGPNQSLEHPLGVGGEELHGWMLSTRTWRQVHGMEGGETGIDDDFAAQGFENTGAWILGRNMFAPSRGPWTDMSWKGWWGTNPPYHVPVFVLTHHAREPIEMEGDTTFHFVTGGIDDALRQAREAAHGKDIRIGGGANTIQQWICARQATNASSSSRRRRLPMSCSDATRANTESQGESTWRNQQRTRSACGTIEMPKRRPASIRRPFLIHPSARCTAHPEIFRPGRKEMS